MTKYLATSVKPDTPTLYGELPVVDGRVHLSLEESKTKFKFAAYIFIAFLVFLIWAFIAPLDGGVHITGTVVVQGNRKVVKHPRGGVVEQIFVKEGSVVKQGDTLIRINPLSLQAELNAADLDYINALVVESRLAAERGGLAKIRWLSELEAFGKSAKALEAKAMQERILESRRTDMDGKLNILAQEILNYEAQIHELNKLLELRKDQLKLFSDDLGNLKQLASEGFVPRSKANEMERSRSDLSAGISGITSSIFDARSAMAAAKLKIMQEKSAYIKEVDAELSEVQKNRKAYQLNSESLRFNLSLTDIKAPVSGTVVGLKIYTEGGVIQAGETLLEVVPQNEKLIVHAKVPTTLIDKVQTGLESDLRFTAFNQSRTPVIAGKVVLVGVDKQLKSATDDTATPSEYYLAYIETKQEGTHLLGQGKIQPGMAVDVIVKTGERTFMSYLLKPIMDRLAFSFKDN